MVVHYKQVIVDARDKILNCLNFAMISNRKATQKCQKLRCIMKIDRCLINDFDSINYLVMSSYFFLQIC